MATTTSHKAPVYGLMAEFLTPQELLDAIKATHHKGYEKLDAYMPYPVEEISHEISRHKKSLVSRIVLIGGLSGATFGFFFQSWAMGAFDWLQAATHAIFGMTGYPFNIGGRPFLSWPAFIPVTFELTILFSAFSAVIGMFALNNLPHPHHPVFNVDRFARASDDRFFLVIESADDRFDGAETRDFLHTLGPQEVMDVDW